MVVNGRKEEEVVNTLIMTFEEIHSCCFLSECSFPPLLLHLLVSSPVCVIVGLMQPQRFLRLCEEDAALLLRERRAAGSAGLQLHLRGLLIYWQATAEARQQG